MSSSAEGDDAKRDDDLEQDEDRAAILQRRRKFVTAALGGLAMASSVLADCASPQPCLEYVENRDVNGDRPDATFIPDVGPQPCLSPVLDVPTIDASDARPQPCLDMAIDVPTVDVLPQPCLSPPLPDVPDSDAVPQPCLRMAPPVDGG